MWKLDPQDNLEEILAHADTQKEGENLVAVGGMHTSEGLKNVIALIEDGHCTNPELVTIPHSWLNWQCVAYFHEDALPNHWQELIAIGNIDNESLALQVSFVDKLTKLRELLLVTFKSVEKYKETAQESKASKKDKSAANKLENFKENVQRALQIQKGALGHMLSIVSQDDVIWGLYLRVVKRDTKAPATGKAKKEGRKAATAMKSHSDLIPFLNLPPIKLQELLENVVEGTMTFKAARDVADIYNAKARCLRQLENLFNAKSGQLNKTRAVQKGRWTTYTSIVDMLPDIPRHLEVWMAPFSKGRLTAVESRGFEE